MVRLLQIVTVLLFIGIMTGIYQGTGAFMSWAGPQFTYGFAAGMLVCILGGLLAHWLDRPSRRRSSGSAADQHRPDRSVDL
jgi:NhaP-type Na+/H+ or K+/H+ antiporter